MDKTFSFPTKKTLIAAALVCGAAMIVSAPVWSQQDTVISASPSTPAAASTSTTTAAASSSEQDEAPDKATLELEARMRQARREQLDRLYGDRPDHPMPAADDEWPAVVEAMKKHSPNWWKRFEQLPADAPWRDKLKRALVERHRDLARIEQRDPEQFQREIHLLEIEDDIFGIARQIWQPSESDKVDDLKAKLKTRLKDLFDARIENREARVAQLAKVVQTERERLDSDKKELDKSVDRRYQAVLNHRLGDVGGVLGAPVPPPGGPGGRVGPRREDPEHRPSLPPPPGEGPPSPVAAPVNSK